MLDLRMFGFRQVLKIFVRYGHTSCASSFRRWACTSSFPHDFPELSLRSFVRTEFSVNSLSNHNIEIHKLSRYIFPRYDLGPTKAGKTEIQPLRSLEYAAEDL